ncbi:MAG: hypothetical protein LBS62_02760 [Clostridiales bacterium]|jgi:S-formylglutathione hydrolase FrmB|nr:hypothetical protein [Clostridiales bacterium]
MALITAKLSIAEAFKPVNLHLYFPTDLPESVGNRVKGVITLLHGLHGDCSDWFAMTAACRYAADNGYILIAPSAENSFYNDMAHGSPWYAILTESLPEQLRRIYNIPAAREVNYIAGLSMGGYGALRIGLARPKRYAAAGSFSGVVDMRAALPAIASPKSLIRPVLEAVFGEQLVLPADADVFTLAERAARLEPDQRPRLWLSCGRQDTDVDFSLYGQNKKLASHLTGLGLDFEFKEWDGVHEWNFWDRSLAEFIGFIQGSDYAARKRRDWA